MPAFTMGLVAAVIVIGLGSIGTGGTRLPDNFA